MTQEELWQIAYENSPYFLREGLGRMKAVGYTIEYNEKTKHFTCISPEENSGKKD